jgi:hypothetical protein
VNKSKLERPTSAATVEEEPSRELEAALMLARSLHVVFLIRTNGSIGLWAPGVRIPRALHRARRLYGPEIRRRLVGYDVSVCPSPHLHWPAWSYRDDGQHVCRLCARLDRSIEGVGERTSPAPGSERPKKRTNGNCRATRGVVGPYVEK